MHQQVCSRIPVSLQPRPVAQGAEIRLAGDPALAMAADSALAKIIATLPDRVQAQALHIAFQVYRLEKRAPSPALLAYLRKAIWDERAFDIR